MRSWNADFREPDGIPVAVDRDILALPIGQRRHTRRELQVPHVTDHDGMGMPFDDVFHLAINCGQPADEQRHAGSCRRPFGACKTLGALEAALACKLLGNLDLIGGQDIDPKDAVPLN